MVTIIKKHAYVYLDVYSSITVSLESDIWMDLYVEEENVEPLNCRMLRFTV